MRQILESLEDRRLMSITLSGNNLIIEGRTATNDDIIFNSLSPTSFTVSQGKRFTNTVFEIRGIALTPAMRIIINTGVGQDRIAGASEINAPFFIDTGSGDDLIGGGPRGDVIHCGGGDDTVFSARGGDDQIFGEGDDDFLDGDTGNDFFDGGPGADTIRGGPGSDSAVISSEDDIDLSSGTDGIVVLGTDGDDHIKVRRRVTPAGAEAVITINGVTTVTPYRNGETVTIRGGKGNDVLIFDHSAAVTWRARIFGELGHDRLFGARSDDLLDGGPGDDKLFGRGGNDTFVS